MTGTLTVNEIFTSIQGESTFAGVPCFFIRLAGCNLRCRYCDTKYASEHASGKIFTVGELLGSALKSNIRTVEITGGEPLLQAALPELCRVLVAKNLTVLLETNGSLSVKDIPPEVIKIIDCKTPSSGEAGKMDFSNFSLIKSNDEIKFVIADRNDYDYSVKMKKEHKLPERTKNILFSPVWGKLPPEILAGWIVDDKLPVRFQVQLHKVLWGAGKRCV